MGVTQHQKGKFRIPKPKGGGNTTTTGFAKTRIWVFPSYYFWGSVGFQILSFGFSKTTEQGFENQTTETRSSEKPKENSKHKEENTKNSTKHKPGTQNTN